MVPRPPLGCPLLQPPRWVTGKWMVFYQYFTPVLSVARAPEPCCACQAELAMCGQLESCPKAGDPGMERTGSSMPHTGCIYCVTHLEAVGDLKGECPAPKSNRKVEQGSGAKFSCMPELLSAVPQPRGENGTPPWGPRPWHAGRMGQLPTSPKKALRTVERAFRCT